MRQAWEIRFATKPEHAGVVREVLLQAARVFLMEFADPSDTVDVYVDQEEPSLVSIFEECELGVRVMNMWEFLEESGVFQALSDKLEHEPMSETWFVMSM
jgi:hypothetical protein